MNMPIKVNSSPSSLTTPPRGGRKETDFLANARAAYGDALPDWIEALAIEANRTTGAAAGKRIGLKGGATVTQICNGTYGAADWSGIEQRVRGALMGESVECMVLGEITRDQCLDEQGKRHVGTSAVRTALYHACRSGCPHSRLKIEGGANV